MKKEDKKVEKKDKKQPLEKKIDILDETKKVDKKFEKEGKKKVTEVRASAKYLRVSPKKVKLVIDVIRDMKVETALNQLRFVNKEAVKFVAKLLNSAIANAKHNFNLEEDKLYIKHIAANQGPTLHRWKPAAFGRAHPIRKRSTHLEIILGVEGLEKEEKKVKAKGTKKEVKKLRVKKIIKKKKQEFKKEDII